MNWLLPATVTNCVAIALLATTNWYLYGRYRQRYMLIWSVAWTLGCLRYACAAVWQSTPSLEFTYKTLAVLHAVSVLVGSVHFLGRPTPRWLAPAATAVLSWSALAVFLRMPPFWRQAPVFFTLAGLSIVTGLGFLRAGRDTVHASKLTVALGMSFIVWGVHQGSLPVLYHLTWYTPIGFLLSSLLALANAVGILTLYFERALAESAAHAADLADSEQRFRRLFEGAPDSVFLHDAQGRIHDVNRMACESLDYTRDELLTMNVADIRVGTAAAGAEAVWQRLSLGQTAIVQGQHRRRDGSAMAVEAHVTQLAADPPLLLASVRDITEREEAEARLAASEALFRLLAENSTDMISRHAPDGTYLYASPACECLLGYRPDELVGRSAFDLIEPDDHASVLAALASILSGSPGALTEYRLRRRDGGLTWVESTSRVIVDPVSGETSEIHASTRDITKRKQAEAEHERLGEQLEQARKMESVGRLAGGVAHDFNNMLQAILGNTDLLLDRVGPDSRLREHLNEIRRSAMRSAGLTRQLLGFARRQTIVPRVLDLNDAVEGTLRMLRRLIGEATTLDWQPDPALWPVCMDPTQIDQLLVNLSVNARDAIGGVGAISLATANASLPPGHPLLGETGRPGAYVRLTVRDTGVGMSAETQQRLFEPFFTTKGLGEGTGLGLATVYGIVTQNGGTIDVESELGAGSTFSIYLPAASPDTEPAAAAAAASDGPRAAAPPTGGSETLLVVEDEAQILSMVSQTLERQGYTVLASLSPERAVSMAEQHGGPIDLLVTDVIMPEMNGRELADRLLATRPAMRCLFTSGYDADIVARQGIVPGQIEMLAKPFSMGELAARVRQMLDQASTPPNERDRAHSEGGAGHGPQQQPT